MANELTILGAAREVSSALSTIVNTYYTFRMIRKEDMVALDVRIKAFQRKTISQEAAEIVRLNIKEIADTQRYIDQQHLTGVALDMAMEQLRNLNIVLMDNVNTFRRY